MLKDTALGLAALGWSIPALGATHGHGGASSTGTSASPVLQPFQDPLRVPPVLKPVMRGKTAYYTMRLREGYVKAHRDLPPTLIWGFNGLFPGPTIRAVQGRPVMVRQFNQLPAMAEAEHSPLPAVHLHGAHVMPEHDGHPQDAIPVGGFRDYHYPNLQRPATLFYHDHAHGATGKHVYQGLAGLYIIEDANEAQHLRLPRGERDVPLVIQDRTFKADGSLVYTLDSATRETGMHGDTILVNGVVQPYLVVSRKKYRFRILNASNARIYELHLNSEKSFAQIATDGGLLPRPLIKSSIVLAPSERAEVIIDFSEYSSGRQIVLKNAHGKDRTADIMRFDVVEDGVDQSDLPDCLSEWRDIAFDPANQPREFTLNRQTVAGLATWTINGKAYSMGNPPMARIKLGIVERWRFLNPTVHPHPMHLHLVQFQVLDINGQTQDPAAHGWKDTVTVPPNGEVTLAARFGDYTGRYLFHCHNLEHEDFAMMGEFEVVL